MRGRSPPGVLKIADFGRAKLAPEAFGGEAEGGCARPPPPPPPPPPARGGARGRVLPLTRFSRRG
jgi:hypothetical protein